MADWTDIERITAELPGVTEVVGYEEWRTWRIAGSRGVQLVWERPVEGRDRESLGDAAPTGPTIAVRVPDLETKELRLAELPEACFTIPHFDGFPAVLVRLDVIDPDDLRELIEDGWVDRARKRDVAQWEAQRSR